MTNNKDHISFSESRISFQNQSSIGNIHYADIFFKVKFETQNGQEVRVSGGIEELGFWKPEKGLIMKTTNESYPIWYTTKEITCPVEMEFNYKYVAFNPNTKESVWESNMPNRFLKVESWGKFEIMEEKGNKQREIKQLSKISENANEEKNDKIDFSPINNDNFFENGGDSEFELRRSLISFYTNTNNNKQNSHELEILNYDQVKIDSMQNNPLSIGLKHQIKINPEEDQFIILTAILPFNITKKDEKYSIVPKYNDDLYESLFRIKEQKQYDIYWIGMLDNYEKFYIQNQNQTGLIDSKLVKFLNKEKIYVVTPELKDYKNYWIYINHILGKIFYENKIPVNDDIFINYDKYWESYRLINEIFALTTFNEANSRGFIMIHDINLSLVSHYISQKNNYAKMGFYFHSIFPSLEVLKSLAFHQELLQSIILCNLICFHHVDIALKFLNAFQRVFEHYYEVKPGGKIIINYQGRIIHILIMHVGIDLENIENILKSKEFSEKKEKIKSKIKYISNNENKEEKEKYVYFGFDGLLDKNKILIKFQAFDYFYDSYLKNLKKIKIFQGMDKIIEENEEYINSCKSINEVKLGLLDINSNNNSNINKNSINLINLDKSINNLFNQKENKKELELNKNIEEDNKIKEKIKTVKNQNLNESTKKKIKKIKIKKGKSKKSKSKSGINLSQTSKDILLDLKLSSEINDIYLKKEPIFIQIIKDSESDILSAHKCIEQQQKEIMENDYNCIINFANEINKKYNREIIIVKRVENFSLTDLYSLFAIGDCFYSLRKDYNSSIQIQSFIYTCNYLNKTYDIILNENSTLSPGIKGVKKLNPIDIFQNISALEQVFTFNYINKYMNINNIKFINNNQIINWAKIFFSELKKVYINENNSQKIVIGLGLGFSLMKLSRDFLHLNKKEFTKDYQESNKNLIILDCENIVHIFTKDNKEQKENVLNQLKILASQEKNKVYIISGCKKGKLDEFFGGMTNIGLASEYGFFYKNPGENHLQSEYHQLFEMNDWSWKKGILPILKGFTDRTEGSYIIEKDSMISWVYKNCDPNFGPIQANEMISHIKGLLFQNDSIIVAEENDAVNIRPKNINKGYFISKILKEELKNGEFPEFIMVIGDQDGDEEMFKYLNYLKNNFEIKSKLIGIYDITIGRKVSNAHYYLNECNEILEYIENLNKEYGNSSSKYSQEIYNLVEQSDEYDLYSKKDHSYYDL